MSNIEFKLNGAGVRALLQSSAMLSEISKYGNRVLSRAGDGYEMDTGDTGQRVKVRIRAATFRARLDNARSNTLLKALGGG